MKVLVVALTLMMAVSAQAALKCETPDDREAIAEKAVNKLVELTAKAPYTMLTEAGTASGDNVRYFVRVIYASTLDAYLVKLRRADCRILAINSISENLPY